MKYLSILFLFFSFQTLTAQTDIALELQIYPTGYIPGISIDKHIGTKHVAYLRGGFNVFNHRDLGVQLNEEGSGYGFSLGYKRYLNDTQTAWRFGLKNDVWWNTVDWAGFNSANSPIFGETKIIVIQPTVEVDYVWDFGNILFAPSLAFGLEWNVKTEGEPTGEGPILLFGFQVGKRI